jgi:hypothetical protein
VSELDFQFVCPNSFAERDATRGNEKADELEQTN